MELLHNFPAGPLDRYRKLASFDWKKMKVSIETEDIIRFKNELELELRSNPLFTPSNAIGELEDIRHISTQRFKAFRGISKINLFGHDNTRKPGAMLDVTYALDNGTSIRHSINFGMVVSALLGAGTEKHQKFIREMRKMHIICCFCLTEVSHGTNVNGIRTTATFDIKTGGFVMNTPDFEAAKCWAGLLGQIATHAVVFAKLYTPDGVCHGMHPFFIQIRDTETMLPLPGLVMGDMGEKNGINEVDNGFLMFNNYLVTSDALLNRHANVTPEGKYVRSPSKHFRTSSAVLSQGRVVVTNLCTMNLLKGITIAIRYSAVRKQFGPDGTDEEIPILEYQLQQHRLLPHLAAVYALKIFSSFLLAETYQMFYDQIQGNDTHDIALEIHVISSASKPVSSWSARDALIECREACGGFGYLRESGIGKVQNNNDVNATYEGENHILIQQTSNWLLKYWPMIMQGGAISSPLESINFMSRGKDILRDTFKADSIQEISRPEYIIRMYQWLVCYLLKITYNKRQNDQHKGAFQARNENQVYFARNLGVAYIQHFILHRFLMQINEIEDPAGKDVLVRLFGLYGLFSLEKHIGHLYQGGFLSGEKPAMLIQEAILELCRSLKDDAVSLVDAIAPSDFLVNSVLGHFDGNVYGHLRTSFFKREGANARPKLWKDILNKPPKTSQL